MDTDDELKAGADAEPGRGQPGQALLEDVELIGRVRLSEVKAAQSAVIEVARRLEAEGEIINTGPLSKEVYV